MSQKSLYAYAWDIAEEGADAFAATVRGLGLDTVALAGSYHAGKFLRPHGRGKVYFPDDGTVYFNADPARYGAIRPAASAMLAEVDMLATLTARDDIATNAWLVLLHNTRLGMAHPEATVRTAFGDPLVYSLCPSAPEARAYAVGLCADVSHRYDVARISVETPGFLPFAHGYHHEFQFVRPNPWLDNMLGLCFCDHCVAGAGAAGIDARALKARVAAGVEAYLGGEVDFPDDMAAAFWQADTLGDADLGAYLKSRADVVTGLVADIRAAMRPGVALAVIPSVARPTAGAWYEGTDLAALAGAGHEIEACFYEPSPGRVAADLFDLRRRLGEGAVLRGILRPAHPDFADRGAFVEAVRLLVAGGVADLGFYNYGHLRRGNLAWIAAALAAVEQGA